PYARSPPRYEQSDRRSPSRPPSRSARHRLIECTRCRPRFGAKARGPRSRCKQRARRCARRGAQRRAFFAGRLALVRFFFSAFGRLLSRASDFFAAFLPVFFAVFLPVFLPAFLAAAFFAVFFAAFFFIPVALFFAAFFTPFLATFLAVF